MQTFIHYFFHLVFPLLIAIFFFRNDWKKAYLILLSTMLVDIDHLLATPIFQANRCSIHFHLLHTYYAMIIYFLMLFLKRPFNLIGLGLVLHMFTDLLDCTMTYYSCGECLEDAPALPIIKWIVRTIG